MAEIVKPQVKDLMNPESTQNLEVETQGAYLYNEMQTDPEAPNTHKWHGWVEEQYSGGTYGQSRRNGGSVRSVLLSGSYGEFSAVRADRSIEAPELRTNDLYVHRNAAVDHTLAVGPGSSEAIESLEDGDIVEGGASLYVSGTSILEGHAEVSELSVLSTGSFNGPTSFWYTASFWKSASFYGHTYIQDLEALKGDFQTLVVSSSTKLSGSLDVDAPSFFQTTSVFQKDVYVNGNLFVEGSASYINTDQLYIEDKSITVASGAVSPEAADGAGFDIDGAGVEFHYNAETDRMTLNKDLEILGTGSIIASSGSIEDLTSNQINVTNLTASHAEFTSASGYFTGSFSGDGSGLTGVTMSVSDAPKCKHVINLEAGQSFECTHPFSSQNVLVQVYKWSNLGPGEYPIQDEIANWEEPAIQVQDATITVFPNEDTSAQDRYKVKIEYPEELHGYVVIADAGLYVSGSGFVDIVEATRAVCWYGDDEGLDIIPSGAVATDNIDIVKGEAYTFQHSLGTKNIIVNTYRYYQSENGSWYPVLYQPEYVVVKDINTIEVKFSGDPEPDEDPLEQYFGYIVVAKAGSVIKNFQIGTASLDEAGVHYGTSGIWSAHAYTTDISTTVSGSAEVFEVEDLLRVPGTIDATKIGNINTGEQYYEDYYGENDPIWGSYMEFTDHGIASFVQPDGTYKDLPTASLLDNNGDLYLRGGVVTNHSSFALSDYREKENIVPLDSDNALAKLRYITGVTFNWKKDGTKDLGVIAQEIQAIYPELTKVYKNLDGDERISVNYNGLTAVLIEAVKKLANQVESLTAEIEQLRYNANR